MELLRKVNLIQMDHALHPFEDAVYIPATGEMYMIRDGVLCGAISAEVILLMGASA